MFYISKKELSVLISLLERSKTIQGSAWTLAVWLETCIECGYKAVYI